jgi:hypothetical protein
MAALQTGVQSTLDSLHPLLLVSLGALIGAAVITWGVGQFKRAWR